MISPDRNLLVYSIPQALHMAGASDRDSDLERDLRLESWLGSRRYWIVESPDVDQYISLAASQGVEILLVKEKTDVNQS